jgi:hypothetical protein
MEKQLFVVYGIPVLGGLLALLVLLSALRAGRRQRLVADLPTSKTTGVFIGLVELSGTAEAERPLVSFLAEGRCVYYQWNVDEHWSRTVTETYTDSQGKTQTRTRIESGWTTVAQGCDGIEFYLRDDCGVIAIQPDKAKVEPVSVFDRSCGWGDELYYGKGPLLSVPDSTHRRRFVEYAIPLHAPLYVVGQARERIDVVAPEIAYDPHAEMFLISTRTEDQVRRGLGWQFWLLGILGVAFSIGGFVVPDAMQDHDLKSYVLKYVLAGAGFALAWFLGWIGMVYNSLIALCQRVQQAWSNVDVQLKRRHDLIPNLVAMVQGLRDHERTLQTELAHLRAQLMATPPGQPGPDPRGTTAMVGAIVERYPELKANSSFLHLQKNLVDTEQRIALARAYFNDITSFYNTRLQRIPDGLVAALAGLTLRALMTADQFERAAVEVKLAA